MDFVVLLGKDAKKVPGTNGGNLSRILPSLTRGRRILGPKSNIGSSQAVQRFLKGFMARTSPREKGN